MDVAEHQRTLYRMIREGRGPSADAPHYYQHIAHHETLDIVRDVSNYWTADGIQRASGLTTRALKALGYWEQAQKDYIEDRLIEAYIPEMGFIFRDRVAAEHPDTLMRSVAQFESALIRARDGVAGTWEIEWDRDPIDVINWLGNPEGPLNAASGAYLTEVGKDLPNEFEAYQLEEED